MAEPTTAPSTFSRRTMLGGTVAAAVSAAGLSACNLAKGGGGGGSGTTLNVWGGVPNETGPDELCKAFMDEHPDIKVTYTRYVNDDDGNIKLDTALSGGVPIDVYFSYSPTRVAQRAQNGLAMDLTDKISKEKDFAAFTADASPRGNYVFDGKLYCIPAALAPVTVYVNKAMVDKAGIKLGTEWTVDEFVDVATELSGKGRFGTLNSPSLARPMLGPDYRYTDGGTASNFANPWFAKELELAIKLQKAKVAMDQQTVIAEKLQTFSQTPFIAGRVAMLISSGQIIRSINDTKGYPHDFATIGMPIPTPEKGKPAWNTGQIGDLIAISPKTRHPDAAWELTKFWMRNAGRYMVKGGRLPSLQGSTSQDEMLGQLLTDQADTLYDVPSWKNALFGPAVKYPVDTIFTAGTAIDLLIKDLTDETLLGDRTVKSWVSEAVKQADAAIKKAGS